MRQGRASGNPELLVVVAAALAIRAPIALSRSPLTYDDGVYLASAGAMRAGGLPFRDVVSSQGPAFLPLLWTADAVGFRTSWSPRILPLVAIILLVVATHRVALRTSDRWGAGLAAVVVASSGVLVFTTSRIGSDAITAALGALAVLAASGEPSRRRDATTAVVLGLAVAVKSLFAAPAALAVAWMVVRRGGVHRVLGVAAGAGAVLLITSLPWGLLDVWEQSFAFHLRGGESPDVGGAVELALESLLDLDRALLALAVASIASVAVRRFVARRSSFPLADRDLVVALWLWLAAGIAVNAVLAPAHVQYLTTLIAPAALLLARHRPPLIVAAAVLVLALPGQADRAEWARTDRVMPDEEAAIDLLRDIVPRDALVISDEHALPWLAGRGTPGAMVDLSFKRVRSGDVTMAEVAAAASRSDVCAVVLWSGRLAELPGLRSALVDYRAIHRAGSREILLRSGCSLRAPPSSSLPDP